MNIKTYLQTCVERLNTINKGIEAARDARLLLAHVLQVDTAWLIAHEEDELPESAYQACENLISRRLTHEPMAYLLGSQPFLDLELRVTPDTLIPRPETEALVHAADALLHEFSVAHAPTLAIDIGTGSGAIAVGLARRHPRIAVLATDVSAAALEVARENAQTYSCTNSTFVEESLIGPKIIVQLEQHQPKSVVVTANLPYLPANDVHTLEKSVTQHEPHIALFDDERGTGLMKRLLEQWQGLLRTLPPISYAFLLEFDPPQAQELLSFAQALFQDAQIDILHDQYNRERILSVILRRG